MSLLREPGVSRPATSPPQSSGLFDDWFIAACAWWRAQRTPLPATVPTEDLRDADRKTIDQHAEAALRG